jgi:hypothetical protein
MKLVALTLALMLYMPLASFSPPKIIELPVEASPSRLDADGGVVAVSYPGRSVLGLYFPSPGSYVELNLKAPSDKVVFAKGSLYVLLGRLGSVAKVDLATRNIAYFELASRPVDIASDGENLYVVYSPGGVVERLSPDSLEQAGSYEVRVADEAGYLTAYGGRVYGVGRSFDTLVIMGVEGVRTVKLDGIISKIQAAREGVWVVLNNDVVVRVSDGSIAQTVNLPRGTFVAATAALDDKLVYVSVTRRVVGVVDRSGYMEHTLQNIAPSSTAVDAGGRIWFLDPSQRKIGYLVLANPPKLSDISLRRFDNGSVEVRARVQDPDNDLEKVFLVAFEYQGLYPLGPSSSAMLRVGDFYVGLYTPPSVVTKAEFYVNATDAVGFSSEQKVGEVDFTQASTSVVTVVTTPTLPQEGRTAFTLAGELLLLLPLLVVATLLVARRGRRTRRRKKS